MQIGLVARFPGHAEGWHKACHLLHESHSTLFKENDMKFENLMLHSLFAACLLVCVLTLGAMIAAPVTSTATVASAAPAATATQPAG
jgi:hypothetical protein